MITLKYSLLWPKILTFYSTTKVPRVSPSTELASATDCVFSVIAVDVDADPKASGGLKPFDDPALPISGVLASVAPVDF
uniref:Uncharacterized protein n=1 Tax=Romanomermis culicivorax TaxID=13658 RepID=A0A915L8Y7_ROMCU